MLGKTESEVLVELGQPTDRKNFQDGTTILYYKSEKKEATSLFIPGIIYIPQTQKYVRSSNNDKGNYKINSNNSNSDFDCIYLNAEKKCSAWNVKKPELKKWTTLRITPVPPFVQAWLQNAGAASVTVNELWSSSQSNGFLPGTFLSKPAGITSMRCSSKLPIT